MSTSSFLIVYLCCLVTMLLCRCVPLLALKGRTLPDNLVRALNLIPPAAFAALVANDLFSPGMFDAGLWQGLMPLAAAVLTMAVGYLRKSLVLCIVVGVGSYGLMMLLL
ncbi:MAG: AzlD domain-containing protein [Coriobacteriaceae bacterium]|nr:AzlD domain-containing protein [Coriobacteriaceae bacterium]MDD6768694.1 AzlD domain-containing protein [Coriobacteriaceae bacterium]